MFFDEPKNHNSLKLKAMIDRACDPHQFEPNFALNLDICDFINEKQLGYPMEAAMYIAKLSNSRNQNEALLALTLLDLCAKNCGYSFHLAISTKEFLNSLVRRFPEHPMAMTNAAQSKILELIELWKLTICQDEKYKADFKHIEDMYNLLTYQGYRFPQVSKQATAIMQNSAKCLRSEQELEEEDHAALSAKLQALLQKGTAGALEQANDLMKILAGYDPEKKPNYTEKVNKDLDQIHSQMMEFNDALNSFSESSAALPLTDDERVAEYYAAAKASQPRIQKFIGDCEDEVRMERLLVLNDVINMVLQKYEDIKMGKKVRMDLPGAAQQAAAEPEAALIDLNFNGGPTGGIQLGSSPKSNANSTGVSNAGAVFDDLASINFSPMTLQGGARSVENSSTAEHGGVRLTFSSDAGDSISRKVQVTFQNTQTSPVTALDLKVAVPKTMTLTLFPLSRNELPPSGGRQEEPAEQRMVILNPQRDGIKFKYRLAFVRANESYVFEGEWTGRVDATVGEGKAPGLRDATAPNFSASGLSSKPSGSATDSLI